MLDEQNSYGVIFISLAFPVLAKSPVVVEKQPLMVKGMHLNDQAENEFMHGMMKKSAVSMAATSDGGVIVFVGGKLKKFDKDLNLVKEVVIDTETNAPKSSSCCKGKDAGSVDIKKKDISGNLKSSKK